MLSQTMCEKLEKEVDSRLTIRAERLWSFRFCDSVSFPFTHPPLQETNDCLFLNLPNYIGSPQVWQLLLKNVEFLSNSGHTVAHVPGKVRRINLDYISWVQLLPGATAFRIQPCRSRLWPAMQESWMIEDNLFSRHHSERNHHLLSQAGTPLSDKLIIRCSFRIS